MSKPRKTIPVEKIRDLVNGFLSNPNTTKEGRELMSTMIEVILFDTDNYQGFNYLGWMKGGCDAWLALNDHNADKSPYIGDETRRHYY